MSSAAGYYRSMIFRFFTPLFLAPLLISSNVLRLGGNRMLKVLGHGLGLTLYTIGFRRRIVDSNLNLALGREKTEAELATLSREVFKSTGILFLEILRNISLSREEMKRELILGAEEKAKVDAVLAQGQGAIFMSAHLSNWELSAMGMAAHGYPVAIVVKKQNSPLSQALIERVRQRSSLHVIYAGNTIEKMKVALREGKAIGFMMDQNVTGKKGIRVNFFGVPASSIRALSKLVKDNGTPVIPYCVERQPDGRQKVVVLEALPYLSLDTPVRSEEEGVLREEWINAQAYQSCIEDLIRRRPEQWLWIHRRWKADRTPLDLERAHLENA